MKATRFLKKRFPETLYGRALLILVTPMIFIQGISSFVFFDRHWEAVIRRTAFLKTQEMASLAALMQEAPPEKAISLVQREAARFGLGVAILPPQASQEPSTRKLHAAGGLLKRSLDAVFGQAYSLEETPSTFVVQVFFPSYALRFSFPVKSLVHRTSDIFMMWLIGTSILFTFIAWIFMRNQIKPIRALARAADQFGRTSSFDPMCPGGAREVRKAGEAFNEMQVRIKHHIEQRTEMLAGVSHDLRTPLTRMRLHLELIPDSASSRALKQDLAEMDGMVAHFLDYVREEHLEGGERTALAPVIRKIVQDYFMPALSCDFHLEESIVCTVRPQEFRRLLSNLLSNCQQQAHHVRISLVQEGEDVVLTVEDDGPGVPEQHREDIFRPFFRLDPSRTPGKGGSGLGLSIVQGLVTSMKGTIALGESSLGGLSVTIRFPISGLPNEPTA
ncbi:MAG: HAMP domain-containing protein [Holosporales bacterium]|nr:HAMP domain-containing protein [Holosporales bacterium]